MTEDCGLENPKPKWTAASCWWSVHGGRKKKGLYAIGDIVAGLPQLAHAAMMEGIVAVTHIAGKTTQPINKDAHSQRLRTCEPQIGSIGLTRKQARDAG